MSEWDEAMSKAAAICEEHASWYPEDVFPQGSVGHGVRWKCLQLAAELREFIVDDERERGE